MRGANGDLGVEAALIHWQLAAKIAQSANLLKTAATACRKITRVAARSRGVLPLIANC
jgi:hypothetical protein